MRNYQLKNQQLHDHCPQVRKKHQMNAPERNKFVQAIQHEMGVAADMRTLSKFVREQIFYVFVHDFKDDRMTAFRRKERYVKDSLRVTLMLITMKIF